MELPKLVAGKAQQGSHGNPNEIDRRFGLSFGTGGRSSARSLAYLKNIRGPQQ
jgi:hypothetical protein